ncbi:Smr/MutS family protein [Caldimonas thermodepolymerans]|uniref:DNA mismatch repair protein MutS n=1 Tax=Caldimonas thermodepolymerans TaxID=215580 RepID=A0A2S5T0Z4_9BURK|nr:Smr/MutS family protein [Caldimonas thermodepolymerans]PPE68558.1 DNA mismatch repair protein MutS [Caldimonas thermodepolymerans]QPC30859.1 Smr/MutS family protein [Caldimonas thermodepolymerans]RDH97142.1 DNA-nicking Smr family endonuclease [Caldimonas thermodepolymerans]
MKARSFADLGELKKALQRQAEEAARQEAQRRAAEERERRERELFARTVGPVTALKDTGRAEIARPRPVPAPLQRRLDEEAVLREAISDEFDVESLLETDEALSYRRPGIGPDVVKRLRRGDWVIQRQVDLHGLRRDEARERLAEFLREAVKQGLRCVRVIHGKGNGSPGREPVLKGKVRSWLVQKDEVIAFTQARAADGGQGALVVLLLQPSRPGARR